MPIGRIILKSICGSKKLADLKTDSARLLYSWLIPNVDVHGCFSADPVVVSGQIFTRLNKSLKDVSAWLDDLERVGLIKRYRANGDIFLIIPDFALKQPHLRPEREGKSTIPGPTPEQLLSNSGPTPAEVKLKEVNIPAPEQLPPKKKIKFLDFVFLFKEEHEKLISEFGEDGCKQKIENLNLYIGSKGDKYKSHYHTILAWERKNNPTTDQIDPMAEEYRRKYGHLP